MKSKIVNAVEKINLLPFADETYVCIVTYKREDTKRLFDVTRAYTISRERLPETVRRFMDEHEATETSFENGLLTYIEYK